MNSPIDIKNPPVHPFQLPIGSGGVAYSSGISLRDYFAAHAIQAGLDPTTFLMGAMSNEEAELAIINAAALAYRLADAMLAEREK